MVTASASNKRKKKGKKGGKRKPVNLQANFNRKCSVSGGAPASTAADGADAISIDMFPSNQHVDRADGADARERELRAAGNAAHYAAGDCASGDFHLHSVCSDGKLKPSDVIAKAAGNGVTFMALTDHDTMAGVPEAMAAARRLGVLVVPGVEISAEVTGGESLHILGYFFPGSNSDALETQLEKIRVGRHRRGKEMLRKLEAMGIKLKWERVLEIAGEAAPGRPHVAEAMVESGHVATFREAFGRYLHNDGPAYVEGEQFPPEEAIKLIASAGGVSVLAHPWCCKDPLNLIPKLAKLGIQGVEVFQDANKIDVYGSLARESGLLMMGGSDFHGIDPANERAPGAIPFPRKHVDIFLEHAKKVWERPLVDKLRAMAERAQVRRQAGDADPHPEELLIWSEQEELARETIEALGVSIQVVVDEDLPAEGAIGGNGGEEVPDGANGDEEGVKPRSHYRVIRIA